NSCQTQNIMIFLGDMPFIKTQTVEFILSQGERQQIPEPYVVRPFFQFIPGHPVYIGNIDQMSFLSLTEDVGAKKIIEQLTKVYRDTNDNGVIYDIDTMETYDRIIKEKNKGHYFDP